MRSSIERLKAFVPALTVALEGVPQGAKPMIGILAVNGDGSGQVLARLEAADFLADLQEVLGGYEPTDEELDEARAQRCLDLLGGRHPRE